VKQIAAAAAGAVTQQLAAWRETRSTRSEAHIAPLARHCVVLPGRRRRIDRPLLVYTAAGISPACLSYHRGRASAPHSRPRGRQSYGRSAEAVFLRWVAPTGRCPRRLSVRSVGPSIVRRPNGIYRISKYELRFEVPISRANGTKQRRRRSGGNMRRSPELLVGQWKLQPGKSTIQGTPWLMLAAHSAALLID
jgi:hypothetical protein